MKRFNRFLVVAAAVAISLGHFAAEEPARYEINVAGRLADGYGDPIPGVTVKINGLEGQGEFSSTTNDEGAFRLEHVLPGRYAVDFNVAGFKVFAPKGAPTPEVEVRPDGTLEPDLVSLVRQPQGPTPGMWKELLLFFGIAATGGIAAL